MIQNIFANTAKIPIHLSIGISQNPQSQRTELRIPLRICQLARSIIMLRTIQLNDNFCAGNIEINNIFADHLLPVNHHWKISQKIIPKMTLFLCHVFSQRSCIVAEFGMMQWDHCSLASFSAFRRRSSSSSAISWSVSCLLDFSYIRRRIIS